MKRKKGHEAVVLRSDHSLSFFNLFLVFLTRMRILALEHELSTLHSSSSSSSSRSLLEKEDLASTGGERGGGAKEESPYNSSKRKGGGGNPADGSVGCGVHTPGAISAMEQRQTERRTAEIIEDLETVRKSLGKEKNKKKKERKKVFSIQQRKTSIDENCRRVRRC